MKQKSTFSEKMKALGWAFQIAWRLDKKPLFLWFGLNIMLSVLPAIALNYNREIISKITDFLAFENGTFSEVIALIIVFGILMTFQGLANRVNHDLIYMAMYDTYHIGMQDILMDYFQRVPMMELLKRDVNDEYQFIAHRPGSVTDTMSGLCIILGKIVSIVSLLAVVVSTSQTIFWGSIIYVVAVLILNFSFTEKIRVNAHQSRKDERRAKYFEKMPLTPGVAKEIRVYGNARNIVEQWNQSYNIIGKSQKSRAFSTEVRNLISGVSFYAFLIVMVILSLMDVSKGKMETAVFLMLFTLCTSIYGVVSGMAKNIIEFDYGLFALECQRKFINSVILEDSVEEAENNRKTASAEKVFSVRNLTFSYNGKKDILRNINFDIEKGEVIALVGQNGSGKTTLVKLLLGLYQPSSGSVKMFGKELSEHGSHFIRQKIGVFFQDYYLFHHTIKENIAYGGIENINDNEKIEKAIKMGGAKQLIEKLFNNLSLLVGKNIDKSGVELSGGEKQRLVAARAYMNDREIMIFDEPASMLDPVAEMQQFMNIKEKLQGRTAVLISHRIGFARLADKVIMLENGELAEYGTHDELIANNGLYANFFEQQAKWYDK